MALIGVINFGVCDSYGMILIIKTKGVIMKNVFIGISVFLLLFVGFAQSGITIQSMSGAIYVNDNISVFRYEYNDHLYNYSMVRCRDLKESKIKKFGQENVLESGCYHLTTDEDGFSTVVLEIIIEN